MVPFLFGVAGVEALPGVVLTHLLGDLGLSPAAARACIARLRSGGFLSADRAGRTSSYRLAGSFAAGFRRVRDAGAVPPPRWTGAFHALLYQVPERERAFRDALRWLALMSGYGQLQPGVLIALHDRTSSLGRVLERRPEGARVIATTLAMGAEDAAQAAHAAWDLDALALLYAAHVERLEAALDSVAGAPDESAATLHRFADLARGPMTDTLRDPGLPPELIPPGWIGARLMAAIGRANALYGPPSRAYARRLLAGARPAPTSNARVA